MDSISSRVNKVAPPPLPSQSPTKPKTMKARGEEVYGLAGGEPDQDTPDFIKQAAIQALNEGKNQIHSSFRYSRAQRGNCQQAHDR